MCQVKPRRVTWKIAISVNLHIIAECNYIIIIHLLCTFDIFLYLLGVIKVKDVNL